MPKTKMKPWVRTLILFFSWVVIVNLFAFIAGNRFHLSPDTAYGWMSPESFPVKSVNDIVDIHSRWDSTWYMGIASGGYVYHGPDQLSNVVFFPFYPALIWFFGLVLGFPLAGWVVSLAALLGVLLIVQKYVKEHHPGIDPEEVQFLILIFPTAFFLNAVYTESLFLLMTVASFYFALKRNFVLASVFGAGAALTRVTGLLLVVPLFIEYLVAWLQEKRGLKPDVLALGLVPAAAGSFFLYHWIRFGSPTIFFSVQEAWGRGFVLEKEHFLFSSSPALVNLGLDVFFVVLAFGACLLIARRLRFSYAAYTFLGILVPVSTGTFMSVGRYILVLFPIMLLVASSKNTLFKKAWILGSVLLLALYIQLFVVNYWAG